MWFNIDMCNVQQSPHHPQFHQGRLCQEPNPDHPLRYSWSGNRSGKTETSSRKHFFVCIPSLHPAFGSNRSSPWCFQFLDSLRTASHCTGNSPNVSKATQFPGSKQGGHIEVKTIASWCCPSVDRQHLEWCRWTSSLGQGWKTDSADGAKWRKGK